MKECVKCGVDTRGMAGVIMAEDGRYCPSCWFKELNTPVVLSPDTENELPPIRSSMDAASVSPEMFSAVAPNKVAAPMNSAMCGDCRQSPCICTGLISAQRVEPGYESLHMVLHMALDHAQFGKGKDRHANGEPFTDQPIMKIGRMTGIGGPIFQAMKKARESIGLPTKERKMAELLGAINYLAAAVMLVEEE